MIIIAEGVGCDAPPQPCLLSLWERGMVWNSQHKDGFAFGQDQLWVGAAETGLFTGKIRHLAVFSVCDPVLESFIVWRGFRSRHASQGEPQLACLVFDGLFE